MLWVVLANVSGGDWNQQSQDWQDVAAQWRDHYFAVISPSSQRITVRQEESHMAAVEVTITGLLYDKLARTTQNVVLIGEASLTGLGVGGGPIYPKPPVGIWPNPPEGIAPHPEHPIAPGGPPPQVWPGPGPLPHPEHPIVLPDPPVDIPPGEPDGDGFIKNPPPGGGWAYHAKYGWMYDPGPQHGSPHKG